MTMTKEEILEREDEIDIEVTEHLIQQWTTPVHERQLITCPVCGDSPPPERCEDLEKLEEETRIHIMMSDVPCSDKCESAIEL